MTPCKTSGSKRFLFSFHSTMEVILKLPFFLSFLSFLLSRIFFMNWAFFLSGTTYLRVKKLRGFYHHKASCTVLIYIYILYTFVLMKDPPFERTHLLKHESDLLASEISD